jgi:ATP-dependent Clp protease ATP-binding subunit ClpC
MFERFTEEARQVVVLSQEEARALGHDCIGTEHLLLGLLREQRGLAARLLEPHGVAIDEVRARVAPLRSHHDVATGQIPFTRDGKRALELSLRECISLGHNEINTEHVLLGVLRERQGLAAVILDGYGVDVEMIREEVVRMGFGRMSAASPSTRRPAAEINWEHRVDRIAGAGDLTAELLDESSRGGWTLVAVVPDGEELCLVFRRRPPRRP